MNLDPATPLGAVFWAIIAAFVLMGLNAFWKQVVVPWYQNIVYSDVKIDGTWSQTYQVGRATYDYVMVLKQRGPKLSGSLTLDKSEVDQPGYTDTFKLEGSMWRGYVTLDLRSENPNSTGLIAALLKVQYYGKSLEGIWAYRSGADKVESEPVHWQRKA